MRKNPPFGLILGIPAEVNTKYVYGSGVGALNTSVRRAQKKRASFVCCSSKVTPTPLVPTTYTVSYNSNGGTGSQIDPNSPYTAGSTITVLGNTFSRSGYIFAGWSTNSSGTGSDYNGGDAFIINANTILYAQWIPTPPLLTYTLTYNGNGGIGSEPALTTEYSVGTSVTILGNSGSPPLSKSGYGFSGWNTAADGTGTNYVGGDPFTINANTILYANWIIGGVRLIYNGNGNTGGTPPSSSGTFYTAFSTVDVVGNTGLFTNGSLVFGGWNTASNGAGISYPTGSEYTMPGANPFQVPPLLSGVYLYAQWIPAGGPYTLTYDAGTGGSGTAPTPISYSAGSVANIDTNTAFSNNTSPVFNGWNTLANGTGTSYPAGSKITMTANTTLYAQWGSSPAVTVTYNMNGAATGSNTSYIYPTGVQVQILGQGSLTKPGYAFLGWNSSSTGAGSVYAPGYTFTSKTVTLYAQWAPGSTVKNCGGGTGNNQYIFYNYPFAQIVRGIDTSVTPNKDTVTIYTTCLMGSTSSNIGSGAAPEGLISITSKMVITSATITINTNTTYATDAFNNNYSHTITNGSGVTYWPTGATILSVTFPFTPPLQTNSAAGAPTYSVSTRGCVSGCGLSGTGSSSGLTTFTSFNFFNQGVTLNYSNGTYTIFVSSPNNSVRTTDGGSNWVQTPNSLYPYNYNCLTPRSSAALTTITIIPSTASSEYVYPPLPNYTVEYNGNGATGGSIPVPVYMFPYNTATTSVTISGVGSLTKSIAPSTFSRWNTQANGLGMDYGPGTANLTYAGGASITLYAIWS